ncbi:cytochrome c oxidase assembly protein [Limnochorda pilosa]|uniref:Cytochrome c oxidase assembly protein n=1 Tax=Limnochorda pilosa TaxID=1555112 RepID=A0A0K2SQ15_LIMPI|nr:cytochrome c oxidase assembly protein [Limnochorda pilosa]BAS29181.1 hypothetical protein LIP_3369 [Limnochorda pilosa]
MEVWTWTWDPAVLAALAVAVYVYARFAGPLRPRPGQVVLFAAGVLAVFAALVTPVNAVGDRYLFTLHVVNHQLLQMAAPILFVLSVPRKSWPRRARERRRARRGELLTAGVVFALYNLVIWLWHWPLGAGASGGLRQACGLPTGLPKENPLLATLEDGIPLLVGLPFWAIALRPASVAWRASAARLALLVGSWLFNWLISFFIGLAGRPLYGTYLVLPRVWGLSPLADQALGAGIMWVMGNMMYGAVLLWLLWRLLRREEAADAAVQRA